MVVATWVAALQDYTSIHEDSALCMLPIQQDTWNLLMQSIFTNKKSNAKWMHIRHVFKAGVGSHAMGVHVRMSVTKGPAGAQKFGGECDDETWHPLVAPKRSTP